MIGVKLLSNNRLQLNFRWSRETIELIKAIPGWYFHQEDKYWSIPREQVFFLEMMFPESLAWLTPPYIIKGYEPDFPTHENIQLLDSIDGLILDPYPFQQVGISFLVEKGSALLADDMGLGKTCQAFGTAVEQYNRGEIESMLVICPSSLKKQWGKEAHKFIDKNHIDKNLVIVIDGTKKQRNKLYKKAKGSFITVLNYSLIYYDYDEIKKLDTDLLVLDEAHYIKNRGSKRTKKIKKLSAKYRIAMSGTPMQNRPDELFSVVEFVKPGHLGKWSNFKKDHMVYDYSQGYPILQGYIDFESVHRGVSDIMIRRTVNDVEMDLPEVIYNNYYVTPTTQQIRLHEQIEQEKKDLRERINSLRQMKNKSPKLQETIDQLDGALQGKYALAIGAADSPELFNMSHSDAVRNNYEITDTASPKLKELKRLVTEFVEDDYKVVIFTQFARMLQLIYNDLSDITKCATLYGGMNSNQRDDAVAQFMNDPFTHVIIMTDAGCEGLNLQFSKAIINFDIPWNPSILDQRVGRVRRIGAAHETVNAINIICEGMVDEQILEAIQSKRQLFDGFVENTESQREALRRLMESVGA